MSKALDRGAVMYCECSVRERMWFLRVKKIVNTILTLYIDLRAIFQSINIIIIKEKIHMK